MSMKKLAAIVFAGAILMAGAMGISMKLTQQRELEMEVADVPKTVTGQPETGETRTLGSMENIPLYYDDEKKLLLPLRNVTEGLGGSVTWERESRKATVSCFGRVLTLFPGEEAGTLNGYEITLPEPAEMINGCLYIDSGRLSEYFGADVIWNNESRQVTLKTGDPAMPSAAVRCMEGKKGGRAYMLETPVIVGLNDANFEKSLNEALAEEMRTLGAGYLDTTDADGTFRLDAGTDFLTKDFISFCWNGEKDGVPFCRTKNIDLKGQKEVSLSDLLTAGSLEKIKSALGDSWQNGGFYLSDTEGLVLLTEDENGGIHPYIWTETGELRWKSSFREIAGVYGLG